MRIFLIVVAALVVLIVVAVATIYFTGSGRKVAAFLFQPSHGWDLKLKAPAPDYADAASWAALPSKPGLTASVPAGVAAPATDPKVDVFFVHPTGYMSGAEWNSPLDPNSQTEENTRWMMANQASAIGRSLAVASPRS